MATKVVNKAKLDVFQKHQISIARQTLAMSDEMVAVMGGMTKEEALEVLRCASPVTARRRERNWHL